jgi:hypothetical protein
MDGPGASPSLSGPALPEFCDVGLRARRVRTSPGWVLTDPKTEAGERDVPIFARVRRELLEHRLRSKFKTADDLASPIRSGALSTRR